jgi:hypothetical protein
VYSEIYINIMDFISHSLWGGIAFGRKNKRLFLLATAISLLPDFLTEGLFGILYLLGESGIPGWENGHPNITDYPVWAQNLYNITHSFVIFVLVFLIVWIVTKQPRWIICAWGLHILIDIPTHSLALFPTPFLWPVSDYKFNGIGWDNALILAADVSLLIASYSFWLFFRFYNNRQKSGIR